MIAVRRRLVRLALAEGALWILLTLAVALGVVMLADWWFELPRPARVAALVLIAVATLAVAWRRLLQPILRVPSRDGLALFVERRRPELRSRLISALQLSRATPESPEAEAFTRRLVEDADEATRAVQPAELIPAGRLARAAKIVVPALVLLAIVFGWSWPDSGVLLRRAWLEELAVPRKTRIVEVTGSRTLGRGDDLVVSVRAEGVLPRAGELTIRHSSGRAQTLAMDQAPGERGRYERVLGNLPTSFRYRVRVNDALSEEFTVEVLPRPVVTNLVLTLALPEYTGLPARQIAPGELVVLRGSRLTVEGIASQPLREGRIRLGGVEGDVDLAIDPADPQRFRADLIAEDPAWNSFTIELVDRMGITSRDSALHAVQVVSDRAPRVRITAPSRREELATVRGMVLVGFEAVDDFGIRALRLRHRPAGATNEAATIELDLEGAIAQEVRRRFEWDLSRREPPMTEGELVEFWVEAEDRNDEDGPGIGISDRYLVRVVTEAEKRADLLARAGDAIGRLGDVAAGQERLNQTLGNIILARPENPR